MSWRNHDRQGRPNRGRGQGYGGNRGQRTREPYYETHWNQQQIDVGLRRGELLEGKIRMNNNSDKANVQLLEGDKKVFIDGFKDRNRALDTDDVVVLLYPREDWRIFVPEFEKFEETSRGRPSGAVGNTVDASNVSLKNVSISEESSKSPARIFMSVSEMIKEGSPFAKKFFNEWLKNKPPADHSFIQTKGKIVAITTKNHPRTAVGHIEPMEGNTNLAIFKSRDRKIINMTLKRDQCPAGFDNILFIARITEWKEQHMRPDGIVEMRLGVKGQIQPETDAALFEMGVDDGSFSENVTQSLPSSPWTVPQAEISRRRDLRKWCVFTIDGPVTKDLDDAVSVNKLHNGDYEVGVHIADVSYFVKEGTALDEEAFQRATSVYFDEKNYVIPMLPKLLCEDLCSLKADFERLTFSVIWTVDEHGKIKSEWIGRTVIRSCIRLNFDLAQALIDNSKDKPAVKNGFSLEHVINSLKWLDKITANLRKERFRSGTLALDKSYLQFKLNESTSSPTGFSLYEYKDSDRIIEELMLLANKTVAKKIKAKFQDKAILQHQPPPDTWKQDALEELCKTLGHKVDASKSHEIQKLLSQFSAEKQQVLTAIVSRHMQRGKYICSGAISDETLQGHFCLNEPIYTHFTSPIRRYMDVVVHRQLAASLGLETFHEKTVDELQHQADYCNEKDQKAKVVSRRCNGLYLNAWIIQQGKYLEEPGMVMAVQKDSIEVFIFALSNSEKVTIKKDLEHELEFADLRDTEQGPELHIEWKADRQCKRNTMHIIRRFTKVVCILTAGNEPWELSCTIKRPQEEV